LENKKQFLELKQRLKNCSFQKGKMLLSCKVSKTLQDFFYYEIAF
jgi:hypothetical protein